MTLSAVLLLEIWGGIAMAANHPEKNYMLNDFLLDSAKSEEEILSWAKAKSSFAPIERFDYARTERFDIDGKGLLVLFAARPMATRRIILFVYVRVEQEWTLLLFRRTNTAEVKVEPDKKAKQVVFRSKAGKLLLVLPLENLEIRPDGSEQ